MVHIVGCYTVVFLRRILAVVYFRKIGFRFGRCCVLMHVVTIFDSPLSSVPPLLTKFRKLYLCQHVFLLHWPIRCIYSRSLTQYSFPGCELNSGAVTQGPTVNTVIKGGEFSTSWAILDFYTVVLRHSVGKSWWLTAYDRLQYSRTYVHRVFQTIGQMELWQTGNCAAHLPYSHRRSLPALVRARGTGLTLGEVEVNRIIWIVLCRFFTQKS
jgi:hypothetical protein